jgi:hypothetical protein
MVYPGFRSFKKIPRLSRDITITEKINGTNLVIYIGEDYTFFVGSHNQWLWSTDPVGLHQDNYGCVQWVKANLEELKKLGPGYHYGEFWGLGVQHGYGLKEKRFSLFNTSRWCMYNEEPKLISIDPQTKIEKYQERSPQCCHIVPVLFKGIFTTEIVEHHLNELKRLGSVAVPGYMKAEGVVIFHHAAGQYFKKTIEHDEGKHGQP